MSCGSKFQKTVILGFSLLSLLFTSGCALSRFMPLYSKNKMRKVIASVITDDFANLTLVSKSSDCNTWEITLPERNNLKVRFCNGKIDTGLSIDGCKAYELWQNSVKSNYVSRILSAADSSKKAEIDKKYGLIPGSTEISDLNGIPRVLTHTAKSLDAFSEDDAVGYVEDCLKFYNFGVRPLPNWDQVHQYGVSTVYFAIVFDSAPKKDGSRLICDLCPISSSLSAVSLRCGSDTFQKNWVKSQLRHQKALYKNYRAKNIW